MGIIQKYPESITVLSVAYSGPEEGLLEKNVKIKQMFRDSGKKANFSKEIPLRAFQLRGIFASLQMRIGKYEDVD